MKLKKIISMTLVFAMMLTMFVSMTVSAADTVKIGYVAYSGDEVVTGNLVAGETYEIAIVISDISSGKFFGSEVTTTFDHEVIQLVNASGEAAARAPQAVVSTLDLYDANTGEGTFSAGPAAMEDGTITYSFSVDKDLSVDYPNGVEAEDSFELYRLRIKALKDGAAKIATTSETAFYYSDANLATATVTIEPNSIRVGEVAYVSAAADEAFAASKTYVVGTTDVETVVADLAKDYASVKVTYTDEEGGNINDDCAITWTAPADFDASKAGTYTFTGAVAIPEDINYTGDAVTVTATVTIDTRKVTAVSAIDDIVVRVGDEVVLPSEVEVTVTGDQNAMLAVTWAPETVDTSAATTTALVGTIAGTDDIEVPEGTTAALNVVVLAASAETAPEAVDAVEVDAAIDAEDIAADALAALPAFVVVGTETKEYINVTWTQVEDTVKEEYAIGDVLKFQPAADGVTFPVDFVATVTVAVPEGKDVVEFNKTSFATEEIKSDKNYTIEDAIEDAAFEGTYGDGTKVDLSAIVWAEDTTPAYDNTEAGKYTLTGAWSDIYGNEQTFTIEINIVAAGATGIKLYSSAAGKNAITSVTLNTLSAKTIYAVLEPAGVTDTITWTIDKTSYATVSASGANSATIKTKSVAGVAYLTATTSTGASAQLKITINATNNGSGSYGSGNSIYKGNGGTGSNLLANAANDEAQNQIAASSAFIDLGGYEWAATQIETLRLLGVVTGKTNSTFAPADSVTRAEFLAMLVRLLNLQAVGTPKTFTDVPADAWYYETVSIASSLGVAHGYENGAFDPNAVISRQDMAVFAERARSVAGINPIIGIGRSFKDQHEISDYAKSAVDYMTSISVINGFEDETFRPLETANRAQAAVVIYNLYALKNQ